MSRHDDVPQTAEQATGYGWAWLTVRCLGCRHSRDFRFDEISGYRAGTGKLGAFAAKLSCGKCRGHVLEFALGRYETSAGQPRASRRPIAFDSGLTVRAPRE